MTSAAGATTKTTLLEAVLLRDRVIVALAVAAVAALAWAYTIAGVGMDMSAIDMTAMAGMNPMLMAPVEWSPSYALFVFLMWWIMMIAMMLPSAAAMILLYDVVERRTKERAGQPGGPWATAVFALGRPP